MFGFELPTSTMDIAMWSAVGVVVLNLFVWVLFLLYERGIFTKQLHDIIFKIDEFCDNYSDPEKRGLAIDDVMSLLGWRRIIVPRVLVGWWVDAEVYYLHKIVPDLHQYTDHTVVTLGKAELPCADDAKKEGDAP